MPQQILLRHRFLDPVQIVRREPLDAARRFGRIERLVEVDHQRDVRAEQAAHTAHHALVIPGVAVATLDLDADKALVEGAAQILLVLDGIDDAVAVIGPDRLRRTAQQFGHRLVGTLAERIPIRHVEARDGHADQALPAEQAEFRVHCRHQIERHDGLADQLAADPFDQLHQRLQREIGVSEDVGAAGDALIGLDIDQHQRA